MPPHRPADRQLVRAMNRAMVLREIKQAPVSRAEVARSTGLSQVTVGAITSELLGYGVIAEGDQAPSSGGRPATLLELVPGAFHAVGIKLREDGLVGAVTNLEAEPLAEMECPLEGRNPRAVLEVAAGLVDALLLSAGVERTSLLGLGIGMAGVVDGDAGVCRHSPFLGWRDVAVAELAEEMLGIPVLVDNDVNTLAMAERWFGAGRDVDDFVLVTLGRGIGLGVVANARLLRGARGGAGEFGHTTVDGSNRPCPCGNTGCLEASVSEPALVEAARILLGDDSSRIVDAEALYALATDDLALQGLLVEAGHMLGRGLANVVNLFAPSVVILSGEGVRAGEALLAPVRDELTARVFSGLRDSFEVVVEPLPDAAWARGAASLVLSEIFDVPTRTRSDLLWGREVVS